jgi:hypothetical protein
MHKDGYESYDMHGNDTNRKILRISRLPFLCTDWNFILIEFSG